DHRSTVVRVVYFEVEALTPLKPRASAGQRTGQRPELRHSVLGQAEVQDPRTVGSALGPSRGTHEVRSRDNGSDLPRGVEQAELEATSAAAGHRSHDRADDDREENCSPARGRPHGWEPMRARRRAPPYGGSTRRNTSTASC